MTLAGIKDDTLRRYARGYLMLGLLEACAAELALLSPEALSETDTLDLLLDLEMERKAWTSAIDLGRELSERRPRDEKPWISWAYALRELQRIEEAREVLLGAEALHGKKSALLHYNLACYYCLLNELPEARKRLARAVKLNAAFEQEAKEDPDLATLWSDYDSAD